MDEPVTKRRPSIGKLSKTPSWISLGFVLGALFVWFLPRPEPEIIEVPVKDPNPPLVATRTQPDFTEIEAVFAEWSRHAVWEHDLTEVAMWDVETGKYSRYYEVLRVGDRYFFRSIAGLTRPVLTHGVDVSAPLLFTEPEARRREWLEQKDDETWRAITESIRERSSQTRDPRP